MSIFKKMTAKWKSMSKKEKLKLIITGVCDIGSDLLAGLMLEKMIPEDEKKWKKAVISVAAGGLGLWAGNTAGKEINDLIDIVCPDHEEDDDE